MSVTAWTRGLATVHVAVRERETSVTIETDPERGSGSATMTNAGNVKGSENAQSAVTAANEKGSGRDQSVNEETESALSGRGENARGLTVNA